MISTAIATHAGTVSLTAAATVGLTVFLVIGELANTGEAESLKVLNQNLLVFAVPLLAVLSSIVIIVLLRMMF